MFAALTVSDPARACERLLQRTLGDEAERWLDAPAHEALALIVEDLVLRGQLHAPGRRVADYYLGRHLLMRRAVLQALARREPAPIKRPIFVLGLPRTGTTFLHELLASHARLRSPTFWNSHHLPAGPLVNALTRAAIAAQLAALDLFARDFRRIHALRTNGPHECVSIQAYSFRSITFHAAFRLPRYDAWMRSAGFDWGPAYAWHERHLGLLGDAATRWVLKAPAHTLGIHALLRRYPDALFVQTHRDPRSIVPSMASLTRSLSRVTTRRRDPAEIGRDVEALWRQGLLRTLAARRADPALEARFIDVGYRELVADPAAVVERVLRFAEVEADVELAAKLRGRIESRHQRPRHRYSLEQFGLEADALAAAYADYLAAYPQAQT
ncbi:MAG: sulfotransferase [Pseudomonadota bacterium]